MPENERQRALFADHSRRVAAGETLLALCLKEPWLQLILEGRKTLETRSWRRHIDCDVVLVASLQLDLDAMRVFYPGVEKSWPRPLGRARAIVHMGEPRLGRGNQADNDAACCDTTGRWLYPMSNLRVVRHPFPVHGQLGFFPVRLPASP